MLRRRLDAAAVLAGSAVLVACGLGAREGTVGPLEARLFRAINGLPDAISPVMERAQLLGVLAVGPLVAAGALVVRRWRLAAAAVLVTVGKLAAERLVWGVVERSRPGTTIPDAIVRGDTPTTGASFVSGHVALTVALAWVITPHLRGWWRLAAAAVVGLVAFARIYLGAHAPLDVAGGLGLGIAIGGVANVVVGVPDGPPDATRSTGRAAAVTPGG